MVMITLIVLVEITFLLKIEIISLLSKNCIHNSERIYKYLLIFLYSTKNNFFFNTPYTLEGDKYF